MVFIVSPLCGTDIRSLISAQASTIIDNIQLVCMMKKFKTIILTLWFVCVSFFSPLWIGSIYMNITGHGKRYAYDMGSESDIAVFFGVLELLLWLFAILPVTFSLCKNYRHKKKLLVCLPVLAFIGLFILGICILGWNEFIKLFGYGYPT